MFAALAGNAFAAGWQAPTGISTSEIEGRSPVIALDGRGDALALWLSRYGFNWDIAAAAREGIGGSWGAAQIVSIPGDIDFEPAAAIDPHGEAIAVWSDGDTAQIEAAVHRAGGEWGAPFAISRSGGADDPSVAVDASGRAVVTWHREASGVSVVEAAVGSLESGEWSEPTVLSSPGETAFYPQAAVTDTGEADVAWQNYDAGDYSVQTAAGSVESGAWEAPIVLSDAGGQVTGHPQIALDGAGEAVVVWEEGGVNLTPYVVEGALRPAPGAAWEAPAQLSPAGVESDFPQIALDGKGNATAMWETRDEGTEIIQSAVRPASTGAWEAPVNLSAPGSTAFGAALAADRQGDAVVVWGGEAIAGTTRPAGGPWGAPATIGPGRYGAEVAIDAAGDATVVWETEGMNGEIESANYIAEPQAGGEGGSEGSGGGSEGSGGGSEGSGGGEEHGGKGHEGSGGGERGRHGRHRHPHRRHRALRARRLARL